MIDANREIPVAEALRYQIEVQRRLHEQLEVVKLVWIMNLLLLTNQQFCLLFLKIYLTFMLLII